MTKKEKIAYLAWAVMKLRELGYGKTASALNEIRLELKGQSEFPDDLEEAAEKHIQSVVDTAGHPGWDWETQDIVDAFIAGAEWGRKQVLQEIYDGKVKPVDKITAAWLED